MLLTDSRVTMGCDGGTIPKRHELVKGPKKVEKVGGWARWGWSGGAAGYEGRWGFPAAAAPFQPLGELEINYSVSSSPLLSSSCCHPPGSALSIGHLTRFPRCHPRSPDVEVGVAEGASPRGRAGFEACPPLITVMLLIELSGLTVFSGKPARDRPSAPAGSARLHRPVAELAVV